MAIYKATITVTVFLDEPSKEQASNLLSALSLERLAQEMDEGLMVGQSALTSIARVSREQLRGELLAIGNDGEFFNYS